MFPLDKFDELLTKAVDNNIIVYDNDAPPKRISLRLIALLKANYRKYTRGTLKTILLPTTIHFNDDLDTESLVEDFGLDVELDSRLDAYWRVKYRQLGGFQTRFHSLINKKRKNNLIIGIGDSPSGENVIVGAY